MRFEGGAERSSLYRWEAGWGLGALAGELRGHAGSWCREADAKGFGSRVFRQLPSSHMHTMGCGW